MKLNFLHFYFGERKKKKLIKPPAIKTDRRWKCVRQNLFSMKYIFCHKWIENFSEKCLLKQKTRSLARSSPQTQVIVVVFFIFGIGYRLMSGVMKCRNSCHTHDLHPVLLLLNPSYSVTSTYHTRPYMFVHTWICMSCAVHSCETWTNGVRNKHMNNKKNSHPA